MRRAGIFTAKWEPMMTTNNEAWAFIDENGRVFVHPFAKTSAEVWEWALLRMPVLFTKFSAHNRIEQAKAAGCRAVRVKIEILEDEP
jgi:hypothetical protein